VKLKVHINKNLAGLICFELSWGKDNWRWFGGYFLVRRSFWKFGRDFDYYDGPLGMFGLGPLFLFSWQTEHTAIPKGWFDKT